MKNILILCWGFTDFSWKSWFMVWFWRFHFILNLGSFVIQEALVLKFGMHLDVKRKTDDVGIMGIFSPYFIHDRGGYRGREAHYPITNHSYHDIRVWTMNLQKVSLLLIKASQSNIWWYMLGDCWWNRSINPRQRSRLHQCWDIK